jgi:hypothetical protein
MASKSKKGFATFAFGILMGAPSLLFPFGRDQGLFHHIGREWALFGAMPYRDTFDLKPPPIYALHAILIVLMGEGMLPIRLAEWILVMLLGVAAAALAAPTERSAPLSSPPSVFNLGLGVLAANICYYGFFDFWDTGQCEIWCVTAVVLALWLLLRTHSRPFCAAVAAGALCGFAFAMKPPVAPMILVAIFFAAKKHWPNVKRAILSAFLFGFGSLASLLVIPAYFAKHGALTELIDVVIGYNRAYVAGDRSADGILDTLEQVALAHNRFDPWSTFVHSMLLLGIFRGGLDGRDRTMRQPYGLALSLVVTAALGVILQAKYYPYHWGLMVAGELIGILSIMSDGARILANAADKGSEKRSEGLRLAVLLTTFTLCFRHSKEWLNTSSYVVAYVVRARDRDWLTEKFRIGHLHFYVKEREHIGNWIREHSTPNDRLLVRGFEPSIYAMARRSYGGRFATTHHLTSDRVVYKRAEWLAQDLADIVRIKPRFVVAMKPRPDMPGWPDPKKIDSVPFFEALGYHSVHEQYNFVVMERSVPSN